MPTVRRRALILDDNPTLRKVLCKLFDGRGYEVFTFPDPVLCPLHVARACPCPQFAVCADIIVSDLNMVEGNGIDFLEQLVQKGCKQMHLALMSGNFTETDIIRASRLRCKLFTKPLVMAQLTAWVEEVERLIPSERTLFDWH